MSDVENRAQANADEANAARFERYLRDSQLFEQLQNATGRFLTEFATFESLNLTACLMAISHDVPLVEHIVDLMDLVNRITLLRRLMTERNIPVGLAHEVENLLQEADKLRSKRNEIAHGQAALATAALDIQKPSKPIAGIRRPKGKHPAMPPGGFKSQAQMEQHMIHGMHTVPQITGYYERTVTLNRAIWVARTKLEKAIRGIVAEGVTD